MPSTVFQRGKRFCARVERHGVHTWLGTHPTREAARAAVDSFTGVVHVPEAGVAGVTVAEWLRLWPAAGRQPQTHAHNRDLVAGFARRYGEWPLAAVTPAVLLVWTQGHPGTGRYLRLFFNDAVEAGMLDVAPRFRVPLKRAAAITPPSREVLDALVAAAGRVVSPVFRAYVLTAAWAGLRLGEVAALQASDVMVGEDGRVQLRVAAFKQTPESVVELFEPGAGAVLEVMPAVGSVFGLGWDRGRVNDRWGKVRREVGVATRFHDLRHFHATWLIDQGCEWIDVAVQMRHFDRRGRPHTRELERTYAHPDLGAARDRLRRVTG